MTHTEIYIRMFIFTMANNTTTSNDLLDERPFAYNRIYQRKAIANLPKLLEKNGASIDEINTFQVVMGLVFSPRNKQSVKTERKWEDMALKAKENILTRDRLLEKYNLHDHYHDIQQGRMEEASRILSTGLDCKLIHECKGKDDNNTIPMYIIRPENSGEEIPCLFYIHGGGMSSMSSSWGNFQSFARLIARQGVCVIMPEFRNSLIGTKLVPEVAQYPAGLNDCYDALKYVNENKSKLRIGNNICLSGESGGGNLSLALTLKLKHNNELHLCNGVYALCPYIAGNWDQKKSNEGILGTSHIGKMPSSLRMAYGYSIKAFREKDPLSWMGFATIDDLRGFPRMVLSMNEADPFCDEGINFYRRAVKAGVNVEGKVLLGTDHANDLHWHLVPEIATTTARAMADFCANGSLIDRLPMPSPMVSTLKFLTNEELKLQVETYNKSNKVVRNVNGIVLDARVFQRYQNMAAVWKEIPRILKSKGGTEKEMLELVGLMAGKLPNNGKHTRKNKKKSWNDRVELSKLVGKARENLFNKYDLTSIYNTRMNGRYETAVKLLSPGIQVDLIHDCIGKDSKNIIPMYVVRPENSGTDIPCFFYLHGGGMATLSSADGVFQAFARLIARQGVCVIMPEFRNSLNGTTLVPDVAQYPAGLNDCYDALKYVNENKSKLRIGNNICLGGESGGGNLSLALTLKLKHNNELHLCNGVYALCPYIAGNWDQKKSNEGILGTSHIGKTPSSFFSLANAYSDTGVAERDPLCWMGFATINDLRDFPRTVISVNENDSLCDEGINFYRRAVKAGVNVEGRIVLGTGHASDMHWDYLPEITTTTARAIADFVANGFPLNRLPMPNPMESIIVTENMTSSSSMAKL